jgi:hypothetical protein
MPSHAQTHYAAALEKMSIAGVEATFGEVAKKEWGQALDEWIKFGGHVFESPNVNPAEHNGQLVRDLVRIDDCTNPEVFKTLNKNQQHWSDRWASQMNYPYWKERCLAEKTSKGVEARQLFYEGTKAYKTGDFATAATKFQEGLLIWNDNLKEFPVYREDDLNKKETGLIVKRYERVLQQKGEKMPDTFPFKELLPAAKADTTVDPFDAIEMLGLTPGSTTPGAAPAPGAPQGQPKIAEPK